MRSFGLDRQGTAPDSLENGDAVAYTLDNDQPFAQFRRMNVRFLVTISGQIPRSGKRQVFDQGNFRKNSAVFDVLQECNKTHWTGFVRGSDRAW